MFRRTMAIVLCGLLAACGDPLAGLDRLKDLELSETEPSAAALPSEEEVAREGYFGTPAATGGVATPAATAGPTPASNGGLLGLFRRKAPVDDQANAVAAAVVQSESENQSESQADAAIPQVDGAAQQADGDVQVAALSPEVQAPTARAGFFGRLLGAASEVTKPVAPALETEAAQPAAQEDAQFAAVSPVPAAPAPPARKGLFARKAPAGSAGTSRTGPDARDVDYGAVVPFGEVARSCVARGRPLGRKVDRAPANGYTLFDTKPDTAEPRTFYITGFNDGCPRQLTAANVLLGSASLYERLHYGPGGENLPKGATDKAYEKIKRRVCGTARRRPCGAKIKKMERSTFFVTAYSRFGNASSWSELLIHDGEVLAAALKSNK